MYDIRDKSEAIREIKKYLFWVSERKYAAIERTTIDGIYDSETRAAIEKYQQIKGISSSGAVDYITFNSLYADYKQIIDEDAMRDYIVTSERFPLLVGSVGEDVRAINVIINELAKEYPELGNLGTGNRYTDQTERAVKFLRALFRFPDEAGIDIPLYNRILIELEAQRRKDKYPGR